MSAKEKYIFLNVTKILNYGTSFIPTIWLRHLIKEKRLNPLPQFRKTTQLMIFFIKVKKYISFHFLNQFIDSKSKLIVVFLDILK